MITSDILIVLKNNEMRNKMNDWERDFVDSVCKRKKLSDKQKIKLWDLYLKYTERPNTDIGSIE